MAEPLATSTDVVARLGRALTTEELAKVDALLTDASSAVIAYIGPIAAGTATALLPINNRRIRLPLRPVTAVSAVVDQFGNAIPFTWITDDTSIELTSSGWVNAFELNIPPGTRLAKARVTWDYGFDPIPDDLVGIVANAVLRVVSRDPSQPQLTGETILGYAYTQDGGVPEVFVVTEGEKLILDRYLTLVGPISML